MSEAVRLASRHFDQLRLIDVIIEIGDYKISLSLPKDIKVEELIRIVEGYEKVHKEYGPLGSPFLGLATVDGNEVIDYWLSLHERSLSRFHSPLRLKAIYGTLNLPNRLTTNHFEYLKLLGQGLAGTVFLVRSRITGHYFALKRIEKKYFSDYKKFEQILR